jgi:hypothetical protein
MGAVKLLYRVSVAWLFCIIKVIWYCRGLWNVRDVEEIYGKVSGDVLVF